MSSLDGRKIKIRTEQRFGVKYFITLQRAAVVLIIYTRGQTEHDRENI